MKELPGIQGGKNRDGLGRANTQRKDLEAGLGRLFRVDPLKQITPCGKRISHFAAWGHAESLSMLRVKKGILSNCKWEHCIWNR